MAQQLAQVQVAEGVAPLVQVEVLLVQAAEGVLAFVVQAAFAVAVAVVALLGAFVACAASVAFVDEHTSCAGPLLGKTIVDHALAYLA